MFITENNLQQIRPRKHYERILRYMDPNYDYIPPVRTKNKIYHYNIHDEAKEITEYLRNTDDDNKYYICEIMYKYNGTIDTLFTSTKYKYEDNPDILKYYISECTHAIKYMHSKHIAYTTMCLNSIWIDNDGTVKIPIIDTVVNLNKDIKIKHEDYFPRDFPENPSKSDIYSLDWYELGLIIYAFSQNDDIIPNAHILSLIKDSDLRELLTGLIIGEESGLIYKYNKRFNGDDILKSKWIKTEIPFDTIDAPYVFIEDTNTWMYTWNITRYK